MSENPNNPQPQFNQDPQFSQQAPQYGQPVLTPEQQAQVKRAKILSILAIVFGAIGLVLLSPLFSALGLAFGLASLRVPELQSRGLALTGSIIGGTALVLSIIVVALGALKNLG
ncbi:DUF4190 domain-containing protein [Rothia mucilaginosa]|nr:DUF4190 domain-containing protein [Rothia mucilaginosa]